MASQEGSSFPSTLSWVSFFIGLFSFVLTILNLLALYSNFLATIRVAPEEIRESLGNIREQLLEEREALRQQTRELRNKKTHILDSRRSRHPAHAGRQRSTSRGGLGSSHSNGNLRGAYSLTHAEQTLSLHYLTIRDLWRQFKMLERPFLVSSGPRAEAIHKGGAWVEDDLVNEKGLREDIEMHGDAMGSTTNYAAIYRCDLVHRFIWWQSKGDVLKLSDKVQRIMLRRCAREVTSARMMLRQLRDGGDGPEEIAGPGGGGPGGGGRSRGPTPLGTRRRPLGESSNVYESSDESDDSMSGAKARHRPGERSPRANVSEIRQRLSPTQREPPRGDGYGPRYAGDGWRPGMFPRFEGPLRGPPPVILEVPRASRSRSRPGHDGLPSPYDTRRG